MVLAEQGSVLLAGLAFLSARATAGGDFSPPVSLSGQQGTVNLWAPPRQKVTAMWDGADS